MHVRVYIVVLQQSFFFFIPLFLEDYVLLDHFIYMYILNKSFISKEYSAVVDWIGGSFLRMLRLNFLAGK